MPRFGPLSLRERFILSSTALITLLMSIVIFFVEKNQTEVLRRQEEAHGKAFAKAVADLSENYLMFYDLVALKQNMERAAQEESVEYAIIFNHNARTLAANEASRELLPAELFEMHAEMGRLERGRVLTEELTRTRDEQTVEFWR